MDKGREASAVKGVSVRAGGPRQSRSTNSSNIFTSCLESLFYTKCPQFHVRNPKLKFNIHHIGLSSDFCYVNVIDEEDKMLLGSHRNSLVSRSHLEHRI